MHPVNLVRTASFLLFAASFPVVAEEPAATPAAAEAPVVQPASAVPAPAVLTKAPGKADEKKLVPWRGSTLQYTHSFTAISVSKPADPMWNPYYAQTLSIRPEWHFTDYLFVAGSLDLEQELTLSDDTTYAHQFMLSDVSVDVGTSGYQEPLTGIRLAGKVRLTAPTSLASKAQTKLFSVAPGLSLSRTFPVLSGLTVAYTARYTQRFHRYTSAQADGPSIAACTGARDQTCAAFESYTTNFGNRNTQEDLLQGPSVSFDVADRVHLYATYWQMNAWLYPLSAAPADLAPSIAPLDSPSMRETNAFILSAGVDVTRELSVSLAASTFTSQPGMDGLRRNPFFNRNTTVSLDVALDIEALLSRI
jgi:hypothetical protein